MRVCATPKRKALNMNISDYRMMSKQDREILALWTHGEAPSVIDEICKLAQNHTHDLLVTYWKNDKCSKSNDFPRLLDFAHSDYDLYNELKLRVVKARAKVYAAK